MTKPIFGVSNTVTLFLSTCVIRVKLISYSFALPRMVSTVELALMVSVNPTFHLPPLVLLPMPPSWQLLPEPTCHPLRRRAAFYLEAQVEAIPSSKTLLLSLLRRKEILYFDPQ